jgi:hypothetical protein
MASNISTVRRFIYLNSYAYILLIAGVGIAFIPLYSVHWTLAIVQAIFILTAIKTAIKIFQRWEEKKRSYRVLIERNENEIHLNSFKSYMQAPCGRLLVKVVLNDLGKLQQYKILKKRFTPTLRTTIRAIRIAKRPKRTIIYIPSPSSPSQDK